MHAGLRIWEIWTPELLRPAHVEAARNRSARIARAPKGVPERAPKPAGAGDTKRRLRVALFLIHPHAACSSCHYNEIGVRSKRGQVRQQNSSS